MALEEQALTRCGSNGLCWLWNSRQVWLVEEKSVPRPVYSNRVSPIDHSTIGSAFFLTHQLGWITQQGNLYQTKDGGKQWKRLTVDEHIGVADIYFHNDKVGWLVGSRYRPLLKGDPLVNNAISGDRQSILTSILLATSDGGSTWQTQDIGRIIGSFSSIAFNSNLGIILGQGSCLLTIDGGKRWISLLQRFRDKATGELPEATSAFVLDDQHAWIALSGAQIIATSDGGLSWNTVYQPSDPMLIGAPDTFIAIAFSDQEHGLGISLDSKGGRLVKTNDRGMNWAEIVGGETPRDLALSPKIGVGILVGERDVYTISRR